MKYIVGNWKMNLLRAAATDLVGQLLALGAVSDEHVNVVVCPPSASLTSVAIATENIGIAVGAQNCHHLPQGAYTGELSADMLVDAGCTYVIVGHSERRRDMQETDTLVGLKAAAAMRTGMRPIICIGEQLQQRTSGITREVITTQLDGIIAAATIEVVSNALVAYEPVWAIGTGLAATPEQAQEVHGWIREHLVLSDVYANVPLLYGGSVTSSNAAELFNCKDINGALVGGASLKAQEFHAIVQAARG